MFQLYFRIILGETQRENFMIMLLMSTEILLNQAEFELNSKVKIPLCHKCELWQNNALNFFNPFPLRGSPLTSKIVWR